MGKDISRLREREGKEIVLLLDVSAISSWGERGEGSKSEPGKRYGVMGDNFVNIF